MGIFSSDSEKAQQEHNEGQADGSKASFIEELFHDTVEGALRSDAYNQGWENGVNNKPKDD